MGIKSASVLFAAAAACSIPFETTPAASISTKGAAGPLVAHMAAYNAHNAKALATSFAADATLHIGNGAAAVSGRPAIEKFYADFFSKNRVKSRVTARSIYGNYVVDTERLRFNGQDLCCLASVYEMRGPEIQSLRFYMSDKLLKQLTGS